MELLAEGGPSTTPAASASDWPSPATWRPRPVSPSSNGAGPCWSNGWPRPEGTNVDLDAYARWVVQHTADGVAQDIRWLDRLIATERTDHPTSASTD